MSSPKKKIQYILEPGPFDMILPNNAINIKVILIGGGGGGSSIGTAANGEDSVVRWFGNFVVASGGEAGSIVTDYLCTSEEKNLLSYSVTGKGGNPIGRNGSSKSLTNFSPYPINVFINGGEGFNIGNGVLYGSGGDVIGECDPYIAYKFAGGGSGGYQIINVSLESNKLIFFQIGRGGKGSGCGTDGVHGAAKIEYLLEGECL